MQYQSSQIGYSLVEVLVAIAVLLLSLAGPLTIAAKSLQTSFHARDQVVATYLAQEGIEGIVALKNNSVISGVQSNDFTNLWNWTGEALSKCTAPDGCNFDVQPTNFFDSMTSCTTADACRLYIDESANVAKYSLDDTADPSPFSRRITLQEINSGIMSVTVTVSWDGSAFAGLNREVELSKILYNTYENF